MSEEQQEQQQPLLPSPPPPPPLPPPEVLDEYRAAPDQENANELWQAPKERKMPNFDEFLDKVDLLLDLCKVLYEEDQSAPRAEAAGNICQTHYPGEAASGHASTVQRFDKPLSVREQLNLPQHSGVRGRATARAEASRPACGAVRPGTTVLGVASPAPHRSKQRPRIASASRTGKSLPQHCARIQWRALRRIQIAKLQNRKNRVYKKMLNMKVNTSGDTTSTST